jgi:predicted nucleic acid-binding protein
MPKVLVDTNLLIRAFDPEANATREQVKDARERLLALTDDPETSLVLNPLILFEVTCGITHGDQERLEAIQTELSQLEMISIGEAEANFAARLSRFAPSMGCVLDKRRKFDLLHFASAEVNGLAIATADPEDFETIQRVHQELKKQDL